MTLEELEKHIYLLNERVLGNNIIIQALADVIIDGGLATEDELNKRIKSGLDAVQEEIKQHSDQKTDAKNEVKQLVDSGVILGEA